MVKVLIEFVVTFIVVYLFYYFFIIKKCKKDKTKVPSEVNLILILYKIDSKKINMYKMIKIVSLVTTLILSIIITTIEIFFDNTIIMLIFGTALSVVLAIIFYSIIGRYFAKISNKN